ncbi:MAG: response regulator [Desulfobacteraceae bacterium]|nr:response regulator [Desulfobacteraceae bacterium]
MRQNQTILLVDTSEKNIEQFKRITEQLKIRLILADNGQEALDMANGQGPNLVVIRRDTPVLDALSFSVLLKQSALGRDIPIIVICTDASPHERERFRDAGCSGCMEEPFSDNDLAEAIKRWLP